MHSVAPPHLSFPLLSTPSPSFPLFSSFLQLPFPFLPSPLLSFISLLPIFFPLPGSFPFFSSVPLSLPFIFLPFFPPGAAAGFSKREIFRPQHTICPFICRSVVCHYVQLASCLFALADRAISMNEQRADTVILNSKYDKEV